MSGEDDPQAWLSDHGDYLYRFAISRLHNEDLAADMLQETLLAAWKGHRNFKAESSVRTWLTGILKHKIVDHIRHEIRKRNLEDAVEHDPTSSFFDADGRWHEAPRAWKENPEDLCNNGQFRKVLESCVEKLPPKQQIVFRLRDLSGEDTETACNACDITSTHLHVLLHRARLALRKCLEYHWFKQGNGK
jgi:RNA polymerase sigma-70 factor (ECF subfamily)